MFLDKKQTVFGATTGMSARAFSALPRQFARAARYQRLTYVSIVNVVSTCRRWGSERGDGQSTMQTFGNLCANLWFLLLVPFLK